MVKVSAMMLTHNRKDWLRESIKSILNQTYKDFELIIIDNASTDGTEKVVKEFTDKRIVYVKNEENLYPHAKNQMVDLAKGEYIAICDDDDISMPDRFEKCIKFLDDNSDVAIVYGDIKQIMQDGKEHGVKYSTDPTFENMYDSDGVINTPTVMMRKKAIKEVGGYDDSFLIASDYDLYLRIANKHKITHLNDFLAKYRIHEGNQSLKNVKLTFKYRQKALLRWAKMSCLCFSYNRVFQLENFIRSFLKFLNFMKINKEGLYSFPSGGVQLNVRYQYSKEKYKKGYEELIKRYPEVNFIEGQNMINFREQVLEWFDKAPEFVMFCCDDNLFKDYVDIDKVMEKLKLEDTIGFSLRLGRGINYHFSSKSSMKEPEYEKDDVLKWNWRNAEHEFGYPFALDTTAYKKKFIKSILNYLTRFRWNQPTHLESYGIDYIFRTSLEHPKYFYAFQDPKAVVLQINRVQTASLNPFFDIGYDIEDLFKLWEQGKKLDLDYYHNMKYDCPYVGSFVLEGEQQEKVSVIIPIYNQKDKYFKEAIESVINQTRKPDEIIIVDGGSEPPVKIVSLDTKKIPIRLERYEGDRGIGYCRQFGVQKATGDYISFLSSDDIWDKNFLKIMFETAKKHRGKILYSGSFAINEESNITKKTAHQFYEDHEDFCIACWNSAYKDSMFVNFSTLFIPKEVFKKIQFDKKLRYSEDLDFLLRSMRHFHYSLVNQPIVQYRIGDNLTSRIWAKIPKQNEKIRKKCMKYWKEK